MPPPRRGQAGGDIDDSFMSDDSEEEPEPPDEDVEEDVPEFWMSHDDILAICPDLLGGNGDDQEFDDPDPVESDDEDDQAEDGESQTVPESASGAMCQQSRCRLESQCLLQCMGLHMN